jgi:hypothetical protein
MDNFAAFCEFVVTKFGEGKEPHVKPGVSPNENGTGT